MGSTNLESSEAVAQATMPDDEVSAGRFCEPLSSNHRIFINVNHIAARFGSAKLLDELRLSL
jgi:hypothetical protein